MSTLFSSKGYVYTLATLRRHRDLLWPDVLLIFDTQDGDAADAFVLLIGVCNVCISSRSGNGFRSSWTARVFYRDRYDARLTLIEFARELSSETDLRMPCSRSVSERLRRTLVYSSSIGFFILEEAVRTRSRSAFPHAEDPGASLKTITVHPLDLRFLETRTKGKRRTCFTSSLSHLRDIVSQGLAGPPSAKPSAELDFTYYVACKLARPHESRFIGVSRTTEGDFLSQGRRIELLDHAFELRRDCYRKFAAVQLAAAQRHR